MRRRPFLALVGGGTLTVAGCMAGSDGPTATGDGNREATDLPPDCPTTQGLDVELPTEFDAETVESFAVTYEDVYYREVVLEYEPDTRLDSYQLETWVAEGPIPAGVGYEIKISGGGGVYSPTLMLEARTADPFDGTEVVSAGEIDDRELNELLHEAAETGTAEHHVEDPGEVVVRYIDRLASLSESFQGPSGPGDSDSLYVSVDNATVELTATATQFHGDHGWRAWYYVDERVVRRTTSEETGPQAGTLLECRSPH